MAGIDFSKAPYYIRDNYGDYSQILFNPGTHLQNSELNELQAYLKKITKDVADGVFADGDIIFGAQIIIEDGNVTLTDGKVYLNGIVRDFKQQTVPITSKGVETIGVKIKQTIVTAKNVKELKSPAAGFPAYQLPGANRLLEELILTVNDPEARTLYVLEGGSLLNAKKPENDSFFDKLYTILARRTYDESGHYKVWGLELSQKSQFDDENLYLSLSEGKAYVEGWEIDKKTATTIPIKRSISTRTVKSEPKVMNAETNKYALNNTPVNRIKRVMAEISVSTEITRQGATNGSDPIPSKYSPVVDVQSITQSGKSKTYNKGEDFVLEADTIRWLKTGKQPELGESYNITFTYNKQMSDETDYKLSSDKGTYYLELLEDGDKPVNKTQIQVDYDFYLHYIATITMDKDGKIRVVEGQPDVSYKISEPDIADQSVLILGNVIVAPVNDNLKVKNSMTVRSSMERIQKMYEMIDDMYVNQSITDLDKEAIEGEEATQLKGIITDGFLGFSKADVNHKEFSASIDPVNQVLTPGFKKTVTDMAIDRIKTTTNNIYDRLVTGQAEEVLAINQPYATEATPINPYTVSGGRSYEITVIPSGEAKITTKPAKSARAGSLVEISLNITTENRALEYFLVDGDKITGDSFTMPDSPVTVAVVLKDTTPIPPTQYNIVVIPEEGVNVTTTPSHTAKEGDIVKVNTEVTDKDKAVKSILLDGIAISGNSFTMPNHQVTVKATLKSTLPKSPPAIAITPAVDNWIDTNYVTIQADGGVIVKESNIKENGGVIDSFRWWGKIRTNERTAESQNTTQRTLETAITYMRPRTITVNVSRYKPEQDNIYVKFNGIVVQVTPSNPKYKGTKEGTLKADSDGIAIGTFSVPSRTRCGTVNVTTYCERYPSFIGSTSYTANGIKRTVQTVVTTTKTVYREHIWRYVDPIAQTFGFHQDQILTSIGLYFGNVDSNYPVTIQIRETENGYPSSVVLAEKVLKPTDIESSDNSKAETKIKLNNPVYCKGEKQYAITVLTDSVNTEIFAQDLGDVDLITKEQVAQNPYIDGTMFSSSNSLTWTAHQTKNIKFKVYCNRFERQSVVYFNPINSVNYDAIQILADTSVPVDCKLEWEYTPDEGTTWYPIPIRELISLVTSIKNITVRALMTSKDNVSPTIATDSIILVGSKNLESSNYISRNITTDAKFTNVKIVADVFAPTGTGVVFYYATDVDGKNWKTLSQKSSKVKQVGGFTEYTYNASVGSSANNFRYKIALTTNNTTVIPLVRNVKCIMK